MIDSRLITFITLAKIKSFTKASEILNLTQPAVSQQIKYLEEYYGVNLISKKGRQIKLTEEGEILYRYSKQIELLLRSLEGELKNKSQIIKRYYMGATLTIGEFVIPFHLGKYKLLTRTMTLYFMLIIRRI